MLFDAVMLNIMHFVLKHVLVHHKVVEGIRVLVHHVVRKLTPLGLNHEGFTRCGGVVETVALTVYLVVQECLVAKGRVLLGNQAFGWRGVSLHRDRVVEFTHHFVELFSIDLGLGKGLLGLNFVGSGRRRSSHHQSVEFGLESISLLEELRVPEAALRVPRRESTMNLLSFGACILLMSRT